MKKLTISIVNYNAGEYLLNCLKSLEKVRNELDFDIFVVDNASSDKSIENAKSKFKFVNFIENKKNLPFQTAKVQLGKLEES